MPNLGLEIKRRCGICGKVFIIKTLDSLYCCKKCSDVAYARKKRAEARGRCYHGPSDGKCKEN